MQIGIERGDITRVEVDAIVNAANESLLGGGGVDGAIHAAAGSQLLDACRALPIVREPQVRCPTGEARITPAFGALRAKWVIHAVGPRYRGVGDDAVKLASAFRRSLELAEQHGARTVALPAISCGVFGYPVREAAQIAMSVARERAWDLDQIRFVLFSSDVERAFRDARDHR